MALVLPVCLRLTKHLHYVTIWALFRIFLHAVYLFMIFYYATINLQISFKKKKKRAAQFTSLSHFKPEERKDGSRTDNTKLQMRKNF